MGAGRCLLEKQEEGSGYGTSDGGSFLREKMWQFLLVVPPAAKSEGRSNVGSSRRERRASGSFEVSGKWRYWRRTRQSVESAHLRFVPIKINGISSSESVDFERKSSCAGAVVESWCLAGEAVGGSLQGSDREKEL